MDNEDVYETVTLLLEIKGFNWGDNEFLKPTGCREGV